MLDVFKIDNEDQDEENDYAFLPNKNQFSANNVDFTDKGALFKRQREILNVIREHSQVQESQLSPFSTLSTGFQLWIIILCEGENVCIAKIEKNKIMDHKSDLKYIQRKKAGKRQINFDKKSVWMNSFGSELRRFNEILHQEHIQEYLKEFQQDFEKADVIYLNAPGLNRQFFVGPDKPLRDMQNKIRTLSFSMKKANYTELQRALEELIEIKIEFSN